VVAGILLGVALVLGGIGIGFVLFGGDDDEASEAAPPTTVADNGEPSTEDPFSDLSDPFGGDLSDFSDLFEGDFSDLLPEGFEDDLSEMLPEGFEDLLPEDFDDLDEFLEDPPFGISDIQAVAVFAPDATPAQINRVERAWQDEPLLSAVVLLDPEDLDDLGGGSLPGALPSTLSAFGPEEDAAAVREFVCSFADDPGVQSVQVLGTRPCDQAT
jgi:hypothetical protein